ncbi:ribonuclease H-like domain-containing protein [Tanacetum coccineum]
MHHPHHRLYHPSVSNTRLVQCAYIRWELFPARSRTIPRDAVVPRQRLPENYHTRQTLLRCDSTGDLYPLHVAASAFALLTNNHSLWHQRLGHPGDAVIQTLSSRGLVSYNKNKNTQHLCRACQLGKQTKLPFQRSTSIVTSPFDIIHSDLWTSPVSSMSGYKYYVLFLDHYSYFLWVYPLYRKSDAQSKLLHFRAFIKTQFNREIKAFQCDHGGEFDNNSLHELFATNGIQFRFSCPRTSQQNGKSERMIRTINNVVRSLLFQAHDNLDTSPIVLRLLTTPTSPQQTPPQTTPQATPQTTPLTPLLTPSPLNTTLPPNTSSPPPPPPSTSQHPMATRSKVGIVKANLKYNFHITTSSPIPKSLFYALRDPNWKQAMCDEYKALIDNETWVLVPRPPNVNIVCSIWLYKHKYNADGSLSRYKARLVANGRVNNKWPIHQLDVKNAFLHGHLTETVYMHQPPGFTDSYHSDYGPDTAYLLLYVDDIILTASSSSLLQRIISLLHAKFAMTDLGPLNYFLGIYATRTTSGIFVSQTKYATEILERAKMLNCNPCRTPVDTEKKLGPEGSLVTDPTLYRSLAGALQYLTFTRPDLSYAVQELCLYMHDPREPHLNAMKRVLRYLRRTTDLGLQLFRSTTSQLIAYSDADWAGCSAKRRSTSGYCVFCDNLLTWSSKRQDMLSRSNAEAEYHGVVNVVAKTSWIRNLLRELHTPLFTTTLVYCDNVSAVYMSANSVQH